MAFEELKENTEDLKHHAKACLESNIAYYKLRGFKVVMKSVTMIIKLTLFIICFLMVMLFFSISGAFALGKYLNSNALGFLIVGGVYLIVTGLLFLIKRKVVDGPVLEKFSEIFFNE